MEARNHLCLDCRRLLGDEESCDLDRAHRVIDLDVEHGKISSERPERWWIDRLRNTLQFNFNYVYPTVIAFFVGIVFILAAEGGYLPAWADNIGPTLILLLCLLGLGSVVLRQKSFGDGMPWNEYIVTALERYPDRLRIQGAPEQKRPLDVEVVSGRVFGLERTTGPLSKSSCAAFEVSLLADRWHGGPVVLCNGWTRGFRVETATGEQVRVPEGRVRFARDGSQGEEHERSEGERLLERIHSDLTLSFDRVLEVRLREGDEVVLFAGTEDQADPEGVGYREGGIVATVVGVPVVRIG